MANASSTACSTHNSIFLTTTSELHINTSTGSPSTAVVNTIQVSYIRKKSQFMNNKSTAELMF